MLVDLDIVARILIQRLPYTQVWPIMAELVSEGNPIPIAYTEYNLGNTLPTEPPPSNPVERANSLTRCAQPYVDPSGYDEESGAIGYYPADDTHPTVPTVSCHMVVGPCPFCGGYHP